MSNNIRKSWIMRLKLRSIGVALSLLTTLSASAGVTIAELKNVLIFEPNTEYAMVYVYPVGGVTNPPACHGSNGDYYSFRMDRVAGKEYYSGLLAALMASTTVTLWGESDCIDQGFSETLKYFRINRP